ncbi:MAG TPA: acetyl-CoA decarbonylase/synthase complex subunit gamma [Methanoculleus sp.]|nr:acetyl-CoA decarbonylase/synthase complex subunit gamma [Methanoculleus sp.]
MAMKALDIYKLLPKTNCKKCGFPTCLAFAMKLASGKVDVDLCPDLDEQTRELLGGATRPPIRLVAIGAGERSFTVGEEFVLYRHERTFYHQPGLMMQVADTWPEERIEGVVARVRDETFHRVGEDLSVDGIAFRWESGDADRFGGVVGTVEACASVPEVIIADDPEAQAAALAHCGNFQPLIHAACADTAEAMCDLARKYGCALAVRAGDLEELKRLVGLCRDRGVENLMLDPAPATLRDFLARSVEIRRRAVERTDPDLGYPVVFDTVPLGLPDAATALGILKYAGVIIIDELGPASTMAALTLRQNIYTDPQKPIQVTPGLYPVNAPTGSAPVLMTVNFSLTYFTLLGYLEAAGIPCYLFIVDTEGMSVLTAVAGGKLTETLVADAIKTTELENRVDHRVLIIPGYAAPLSGKIEEETGWEVRVGPGDAAEIGEYLETGWEA